MVRSSDGTLITYDFHARDAKSCVLVIPGFWRDRRHPTMQRLASLALELGFAVAIMDLRGHGDSEGCFGFNLHEHEDAYAVASDVLARGSFESLILVGFSMGGAVAISTAARHELPLSGLLLVSPVADFSMIVPKVNPLTIHRHIAVSNALRRPRFDWKFARSAKLSAIEDIAQVRVPLMLVHVKGDWLVGHRHSVALYEQANEPKELQIIDIPGKFHADRIFVEAGEEIEPLVRRFLTERLERQVVRES